MHSNELFREVDEELQRDRFLALWRRYGTLILVAAGLLLLAIAAWIGWQNWQARQRAAASAAYAAAERQLAAGQFGDAATAYGQLAEDAGGGFGQLARLRQGQAYIAGGQEEEAAAALSALGNEAEADPLLRDLAALEAVMLQLDRAPVDELRAKLETLAAPGRPYRLEAMEQEALLAIRAGDQARATELLNGLAELAEAPTNLRQRVDRLRNALAARPAGS